MKTIIFLASCLTFAACGVIHEGKHDHQATSYQSIHMEHFHAVPTYIKKEDMHYLEHPVSEGKTEAKVEVHHGTKHEPGHAVASIHSEMHGHHAGHHFEAAGHGHGHEHIDHLVETKHYEPSQHLQAYEHSEEESRDDGEAGQQYSYEVEGSDAAGGGEHAGYQYQQYQQAEEGHDSYEQHGHPDGHEEGGEHY